MNTADGIMAQRGKLMTLRLHAQYVELRAGSWDDPYSRLALGILSQAFADAVHRPFPTEREAVGGEELRKRKGDAILFLRTMDGRFYEDRLFWLEVAYPQCDPRHMDRILQSRLDAKGLPKV